MLAQHLSTPSPGAARCTAAQQQAIRAAYVSLLDREDWIETARTGLAEEDNRMRWLADSRTPELKLRAFPDRGPGAEG
jgi:hypothetical protein